MRCIAAVILMTTVTASGQRVKSGDIEVMHASWSIGQRICSGQPKANIWLPSTSGVWVQRDCTFFKINHLGIPDFFDAQAANKQALLESIDNIQKNIQKVVKK